ncbi:Hypothetical predicted protein [Octopus vulgaris]|uniref:Uncharacterized protein n=1 Tax=Octopus vulgaris TaxID=6645 RepID=A0AA36B3L9_OCTVU|nr:Hypothetical predicted protein [Octopus vulgaris]
MLMETKVVAGISSCLKPSSIEINPSIIRSEIGLHISVEKLYQYDICGESISYLPTDRYSHTEKKPYQRYIFVVNHYLKMSTQLNTCIQTRQKPYHCEMCQDGFNQDIVSMA